MSVYSTAVDAYRDTTKWLTAFLPIAGLTTSAVLVGPRLVRSAQTATSWSAWVGEHAWVIVALAVLLLSVAAILWSGAAVLSVEPTDITVMATTAPGATAFARAVGEGVTAPEFFTKEAFDAAMSELAHAWDTEATVASDDPRLTRLRAAVEALREWQLFHDIQRSFRTFAWVFTAATGAMLVAIVSVPFSLGDAAAIKDATPVEAEVSTVGAEKLREATGCTDPERSKFLAVGGDWQRPWLAVDGPGCDFGAIWRPGGSEVEIRLP